jgi:predicted transcriptional regulator
MTEKRPGTKTLVLRTREQKKAVASPLRLELLGLFVDRKPLSVAEIAARMGRPATGIHYHVRVLEKAGILRRVGRQRSGPRPEALYEPVADLFKMEQKRGDAPDDAVKTLSTAFRMAERDMRAAMRDPGAKSSGPYRNVFGARIHCRLSRKDLAELNRRLREIERLLSTIHKKHEPSKDDSFVSLTLALMPLRRREVQP